MIVMVMANGNGDGDGDGDSDGSGDGCGDDDRRGDVGDGAGGGDDGGGGGDGHIDDGMVVIVMVVHFLSPPFPLSSTSLTLAKLVNMPICITTLKRIVMFLGHLGNALEQAIM